MGKLKALPLVKKEVRWTIEDRVARLVGNLLHSDRREDYDLPLYAIEAAIEKGHITEEDMVAVFRKSLRDYLKA